MKYQLLCTFAKYDTMLTTLKDILDTYKIIYDKLYIFENYENRLDLYYTYNIEYNSYILPNTILIHRKKKSNTFYTINALNSLIIEINNGVLDKTYQLEWENYTDTLLLVTNNNLRRVHLKLKEILNLNKPDRMASE